MRRSADRRQRILDLVSSGEEDVEALAREFGVSASTIRRDLADLSQTGAITRTYGGAVRTRPAAEQTLLAREGINQAAKEQIARTAAATIEDGDCVLLDAGSTVGALGRLLVGRKIRVVTSNLPLVPLFVKAGTEVIVLGGQVRPISMGVVGSLTELMLRHVTADKLFLSADGVVAEKGLCEAGMEQCALKELMMTRAGQTFVLADASKLGRASQQYWAVLDRPWTLITDPAAHETLLRPFRKLSGLNGILTAPSGRAG